MRLFSKLSSRSISGPNGPIRNEETPHCSDNLRNDEALLWSDCIIVIPIPRTSNTLHFRAYSASMDGGALIAWVIERLRKASRRAAQVSIIAEGSEEERIRVALNYNSHVHISSYSSDGYFHDLSRIARLTYKKRLLVVDITSALLPLTLLEDALASHVTEVNSATQLVDLPCATPPVIVEAQYISALAKDSPRIQGPTPIVEMLQQVSELTGNIKLARVKQRAPLSLPSQEERGWPYRVSLEMPDDVEILQRTLALCANSPDNGAGVGEILDWWNYASRDHVHASSGQCYHIMKHRRADHPPRRRILYAQDPSAFSGVERVLVSMAKGIKEEDIGSFDCSALVALPGKLTDQLMAAGADVRIVGRDFAKPTVQNYLYSIRILEEICPDIIHAHTYTGVPFATATAASGIPFVQHVHVASESALLLLKPQILLASKVIVVSRFVKRRVIRLGADPDKICVIPNAVATSQQLPRDPLRRRRARADLGIPLEAHVVLVVARFSPNKRHDIALEAFAAVQAQLRNSYLLLAGEAFPTDRRTLEVLMCEIKKRRLSKHVRFLGFWHDMNQLYAASDVLVLPSEDDPLPMAIMEAMGAGVPVIAARSGGSPEMISNGKSGLLIEPGRTTEFAAAIERVLRDQECKMALAECALARCHETYSRARLLTETCAVYEQILAQGEVAR